MIFILLIVGLISETLQHGYIVNSRNHKCYSDGGFYWPEDGSGIPNEACKQAFNHVLQASGEQAAISMFTQVNEYAALAGNNYLDLQHIKHDVVNTALCSAGAIDSFLQFGDKSGMSIVAPWTLNNITDTPQLEFCATAVHNPSIFRIFVSNKNPQTTQLKWQDLKLIANISTTDTPSIKCITPTSYKLNFKLECAKVGTLFVNWQRLDPVGEGFYNCFDFSMECNEQCSDDIIKESINTICGTCDKLKTQFSHYTRSKK